MRRRIRVAQVIEAVTGGVRTHVLSLVRGLDPARFESTVILSSLRNREFSSDLDDLRSRGIHLKSIPMKRSVSPLSDMLALKQLWVYLRHSGLDIVHGHSSKAGFLSRLAATIARTPVRIYSPHCFYFQQTSGLERSFYLALEQLAGRLTDTLVAVSQAEHVLALQNRVVAPNRIVTILNGVDSSKFVLDADPESARKELAIGSDVPIVGTIGRFTRQKNTDAFLSAACCVREHIHDTAFVLISEEPVSSANVLDKLREVGCRVVSARGRQLLRYMSLLDVFVLPSRWEGMPYALLEMMALGKPVVASNIPGIDELVVHGESGYLVDGEDARAIAERIVMLLRNPVEVRRVGGNARRVVAHRFRLTTQIQQLSDLYEQLAADSRLKCLNTGRSATSRAH